MKINNLGPTGINPYKRQLNKVNIETSQTTKSDKVEISSAAKEMQQLATVDPARQKRIDELKQSIQSGTYQADARATAGSIYDYFRKN